MSLSCMWERRGNTLVPADPVTEDMLEAAPVGKPIFTSQPKARRNPNHHKLMFMILAKVVENTDRFVDVEDLLIWLKLRSGMIRQIGTWRGTAAIVPVSIAFESMDQIRFKRVYDRWMYIIQTEVLQGVDPESLVKAAVTETS